MRGEVRERGAGRPRRLRLEWGKGRGRVWFGDFGLGWMDM